MLYSVFGHWPSSASIYGIPIVGVYGIPRAPKGIGVHGMARAPREWICVHLEFSDPEGAESMDLCVDSRRRRLGSRRLCCSASGAWISSAVLQCIVDCIVELQAAVHLELGSRWLCCSALSSASSNCKVALTLTAQLAPL